MLKHGGLALASPKYFNFASLLMTLCHQEMTECLMQKRASSSFELARKVLFENKELRETFESVHRDQKFTQPMKKEIYKIYSLLLIKTLRAKFSLALKKVREHFVGH